MSEIYAIIKGRLTMASTREFLCELFDAMYDELPEAKPKKRK